MGKVKFSICIPAYKRVKYLDRLLKSIATQVFKDFEVIITDDSDDLSVYDLVMQYKTSLPLIYSRNTPALGTPANWNAGIALAKGEWIKLMHDDDWFADDKSLQVFADHTSDGKKFIFSAYKNCLEDSDKIYEEVNIIESSKKKIIKEPNILLAKNVIGPPSVTMIHRDVTLPYDERLKWRVDMEYYIRVLQQEHSYCYIDKLLINVGISNSQVTQSCIYEPSVELPEGYILLQKHGIKALKNIWVYDAWWRLLRNMEITDKETLQHYVPEEWPVVILKMIRDISLVPRSLLNIGVSSKTFMSISYLKNYQHIK